MLTVPVCSMDPMTATTPDFTSEWCCGPAISTDFRCPARLVSAFSSDKHLFIYVAIRCGVGNRRQSGWEAEAVQHIQLKTLFVNFGAYINPAPWPPIKQWIFFAYPGSIGLRNASPGESSHWDALSEREFKSQIPVI